MKVISKCMDPAIGIRLRWTLLIIFMSLLPLKAFGDESFRCKGRIVSVGDDKTRVLDLCGEAEHSEKWEEWHYIEDEDINEEDIYRRENDKRYYHKSSGMVKRLDRMERCVYNFGSTKFKRYLIFRNSKLIKIETGDKGSN